MVTRKFSWGGLLLIICCTLAPAQIYNGIALQKASGNAALVVPFAQITVCTSGSTSAQCLGTTPPLATIYTDQTFSNAAANPFFGDTYGNYTIFAKNGIYLVCVAGTGSQCGLISVSTTSGAGLGDPGANGIIKRTAPNVTAPAINTDVTALFTGTCNNTTFLRGDGACATPPGNVSSVGLSVNTLSSSGIFTITGSPVTGAGTLNVNLLGVSGAIPYFSSTSTLASSALLTAGILVEGGGAGVAPLSGSITDNGVGITVVEGAAPICAATKDLFWADNTAHRWKMCNNNGSAVQTVGSGADINTSDQVTVTHLAAALPVAQGGTGTGSTLTGLVRGSASAMTAAELSGDATTSGSNAITVSKLNGTTPGGTCTNAVVTALNSSAVPTCAANPNVSSVVLLGSSSGSTTLSATSTGGTLNLGSTNAQMNSSGIFTTYSNTALAGNGIPVTVAKYDATAQSANIPLTTLYAVPASGAGTYRITAYVVLTQAATTSSTLADVQVFWTDNDSGFTGESLAITNNPTNNTVGTIGTNSADYSFAVQAKASTNISFVLTGYASSGATPMQYATHLKLEYLGP